MISCRRLSEAPHPNTKTKDVRLASLFREVAEYDAGAILHRYISAAMEPHSGYGTDYA